MNQLSNQVNTISSLEAAEMLGKLMVLKMEKQ